MRLLFIDNSWAFNTVDSSRLVTKLRDLALTSHCACGSFDFLTGRLLVVVVGRRTSYTLILNTGAPQISILGPFLYSLYTNEWVSTHDSSAIIKFADNIIVVDLMTDDNIKSYLKKIQDRTNWCEDINPLLNPSSQVVPPRTIKNIQGRVHHCLIQKQHWEGPQDLPKSAEVVVRSAEYTK